MAFMPKTTSRLRRAVGKLPWAKDVLRPAYHLWQRTRYGHLTRKNTEMKGKYNRHRCFILLSGPSLSAIDLLELRSEYTLGGGLVYRHRDFREMGAAFYCELEPIANLYSKLMFLEVHLPIQGYLVTPSNLESVVADRTAIRAHVPAADIDLIPDDHYRALEYSCSRREAIFFLNAQSSRFIRRHHLFENRKVYYIRGSGAPMELAGKQSNDIAGEFTFKDGSVFSTIAIAIYLGFKEIYLCGAGYTYAPKQQFHFYDEPIFSKDFSPIKAKEAIRRYARSRGVEVRCVHEVEAGYVPECVQHLPVDQRHVLLKRFAEDCGVHIFNVVPPGYESPVYEQISWETVLNKRDRIIAVDSHDSDTLAVT